MPKGVFYGHRNANKTPYELRIKYLGEAMPENYKLADAPQENPFLKGH